MSKRKYKKGRQIESVADFETCKAEFFAWQGNTKHRSIFEHWQYCTLKNSIDNGHLFVAEKIEEMEL